MFTGISSEKTAQQTLADTLNVLTRKSKHQIAPTELQEIDRKLISIKASIPEKDFKDLQTLFYKVLLQKWENKLSENDIARVYTSINNNQTAPHPIQSDAKKSFSLQLNPVTLGHLVGDSFLKKMVSDSGTKLEGNNFENSLGFAANSLAYLLEARGEEFDSETKKKIEYCIGKFKQAARFEAPSTISASMDKKSALTGHKKMTADILNTITSLPKGETCLIPIGWNAKNSTGGHAMLMEYCPETGLLNVYNTGAGINYHGLKTSQAKLQGHTLKHYSISLQEFKDRLPVILEPLFVGPCDAIMKFNTDYGPEDIYSKLQPFELKTEPLDKWNKAQLSGTCSLRCCLAYLYHKLGKEDKNIKHLWEKEAIQTLLEGSNLYLSSPTVGKMIDAAIPNLFGHLHKTGKQADLKELERLEALFQAIHPEHASTHPSIPIELPYNNIALQSITDMFASTPSLIATTNKNYERQFNLQAVSFDLDRVDSLSTLNHNLGATLNFCTRLESVPMMNTAKEIYEETLVQIGRLFTNPKYGGLKKEILESSQVDGLLQLIEQIKIYSKHLFECDGKRKLDLKHLLATHSSLYAVYEIGKRLDTLQGRLGPLALGSYGLEHDALMMVEKEKKGIPSFFGKELEEDYQYLVAAFKSLPQLKTLNTFKKPGGHYDRQFQISNSDTDYLYAFSIISKEAQSKNPPKWLEEAKREYEALKKGNPNCRATEVEYTVIYGYVNDHLPHPFPLLKKLGMIAAADSPFNGEDLKSENVYGDSYANLKFQNISFDPSYGLVFSLTGAHPNSLYRTIPVRSEDVLPEYDKLAEGKIFLEVLGQNKAIAEKGLHDSFYQNYCSNEMTLMELLDRFRGTFEDFRYQGKRIFFWTTLFKPFRLLSTVKENPAFAVNLINFFDEALNYYFYRTVGSISKVDRIETIAFLLEQKMRALTYLPNREVEIQHVRHQLSDLLLHPDYQEPSIQEQLALTGIESFSSPRSLTLEEAQQLLYFQGLATKAQLTEKNKQIAPFSHSHAASAKISHLGDILTLGDDAFLPVFIRLLQAYNQNIPVNLHIDSSQFPLIELEADKANFRWDCLSGKLTRNGKTLVFDKSGVYTSKAYISLFDSAREPFTIDGDKLIFRDKSGSLYLQHDTFYRNYDGKRFYYSPDKPSHFIKSLPNYLNLTIWVSPENNAGIILNRENGKVEYTFNSKGQFTLGVDGPLFEPANQKEEWIGLREINESTFVWKPVNTSNKPKLVLSSADGESDPVIEFELIPNRWRWKQHPQFYISPDQTVKGISNLKGFLVIEKSSGEKEVLFLDKASQSHKQVIRLQLKEGQLAPQRSSYKNLIVAYHYLLLAQSGKDYKKALEFLLRAKEYRRYTPQELKILGLINLSEKHNHDHFPEAFALRLYAVWMVRQNFQHYPELDTKKRVEEITLDDQQIFQIASQATPPDQWVKYWNWALSYKKLSESPFALQLKGYHERKNNLPHWLRLTTLIPTYDLREWGFNLTPERGPGGHNKNFSNITFNPDSLMNKLAVTQKNAFPEFHTRLDSDFAQHFNYLLTIALQKDHPERNKLSQFLRDSIYDSSGVNEELLVFLWIAYLSQQPAEGFFKQLITNANALIRILKPTIPLQADTKMNTIKLLLPELQNYLSGVTRLNEPSHDKTSKSLTPSPVINQIKPSAPLTYRPNSQLFSDLNKQYDLYFKEKPIAITLTESQPVFGINAKLDERIKELNAEHHLGIKKNEQTSGIGVKGNPEEISEQLIALLPNLKEKQNSQRQSLELQQKTIVDKANAFLEGSEAKILAGKGLYRTLTFDDCLILFLQGDRNVLEKTTGLSSVEAEELFVAIGSFLEKALQQRMEGHLIKEIEKLHIRSFDLSAQLQEIGTLMAAKHDLKNATHPSAVLVFEYKMGLFLRQHQIEGLNDLTSGSSVFVQRIQAGGKTLIWGHLLALMKANGEQLSVHVSPKHQYASNLYDMGDRSRYAFEQEQNTLIFDDHPEHFTLNYLQLMKDTLENAIQKRQYIHTTVDTLRALRCKYIKNALALHTPGKLNLNEKEDLNRKNEILKSIMTLLRNKGAFTFDEVHQAMDALQELNMPFGTIEHPDPVQSALIHTIVRLASHNPLSHLKENKQAFQSEDNIQAVITEAAAQLVQDKDWMDAMGVEENLKKTLLNYLTNKESDLPEVFQKLSEPKQKLIVLAHQLLAGGWLAESLHKSVQEHFGVVHQPDEPPIAIPFVANMTPALGSEFSDMYVMMTNTYLSYLISGISPLQAREFIEYFNVRVIEEYDSQKAINPTLTMATMPLVQDFQTLSKAAGKEIGITAIDRDNPAHIALIQKMLSLDNPLSSKILFDYIASRVIGKVDMHRYQVTTNGRSTASMAKTTTGYSASLSNPRIAPYMDQFGQTVAVKSDPGTNGQTIDLLLRKFPDVWVVNSHPTSLFTDLINKLPSEKKDKVRAIIDGGCHFRGIPNYQVARMVCENVGTPGVKGVLFFDNLSGKLCFMKKDDPLLIKELKGTDETTVTEETDCQPHELFAYIDQDHGTGTNLTLGDEAIAISTLSAENQLHDKLQCDRRMRKLEGKQQIITAVDVESLHKIGHVISKPTIEKFTAGEKVTQKDFINDLILYLYLNEWEHERKLNLLYCLQDMENVVQQFLLDAIYTGKKTEGEVFSKAAPLFMKTLTIDLLAEFAKKRHSIPIKDYLESIAKSLLDKLNDLSFKPDEIAHLQKLMNEIVKQALPGLQSTIEVSNTFESKPGQTVERNSTNTQHRQRQAMESNENERMEERQNVSKGLREKKKPYSEQPFDFSLLFDNEIATVSVKDKEKQFITKTWLINQIKAICAKKDLTEVLKLFLESPDLDIVTLSELEKSLFSLTGQKIPAEDPLITIFFLQEAYYRVKRGEVPVSDQSISNKTRPVFFALDELIGEEKKEYLGIFDKNVMASSNFARTNENDISNLLDGYKKPVRELLLVREAQSVPQWKMLLVSTQEAEMIAKKFSEKIDALGENKQLWLLNSHGELAWPGPSEYDPMLFRRDKNAAKLLIQAQFLGGNLYQLSQKPWIDVFREWVQSVDPVQRKKLRTFFENEALSAANYEKYRYSGLVKVWN